MMNRRRTLRVALALCGFSVVFSVAVLGQQAPADLQGTWEGQQSSSRGRNVREFKPGEVRMVFAGDKLQGRGIVAVEERALGFSVNVKATPKQIDYWDAEKPEKKFTAIYKIEGDTLILAVPVTDVRPTDFSGEGRVVLLTLRRKAD